MKKYSSGCFSLICSKKTSSLIFLFAVLIVAFSCTPSLYIPTADPQTKANDLSELQEGRRLYIAKCGGCHTLYLPGKHTKQEWQVTINNMATRAHLAPLEKIRVFNYLTKGM